MENWFEFRAFNSQNIYGYGTAAEAETYCHDQLNRGRSINFYAPYLITDERVAELKLAERDDVFSIGIALADAAESEG